jgi:hypothetical protein
MKQLAMYGMLAVSSVLIAAITGCATTKTDQTTAQCGSDYSCLSDMAFKYRQQADHMSTLAQRYELEAAAMTGQDAQQRHERAQAYWSEAQQADELAQEYRRQLPHNMVH